MENINLEQLTETATLVATDSQALARAIDAERTAEAGVLDAAIAAVRPALRALSSRIIRESYESGGQNGLNPVSRTEYHDARGLMLDDNYTRFKDESGNRGSLVGKRLYLLVDGTLALAEREGSFSHWQSEPDTWTSTLTPLSAREVMDRFKLEDCLGALHAALQKQATGNAKPRTAAALERAERLTAIIRLAR